MSMEVTILSIESAPGDAPRGVEQPNGDLLLPANVRPVLEEALLKVELALALDRHGQLATLKEAKRLLGIEQPQVQPSWLNNLYRVRGI
jgi:hypothetical protein